MTIIPRSFIWDSQYALLVMTTVACFGCTSIGGPWFARTPPDPPSRVFPSVASCRPCPLAPVAARWFERVLIIVLENQDYKDAITDRYLGELATQGTNFTNFHGLFHPSYSNYLAMVAGKDIPTLFNQQKDLDECTVAELLNAKGFTWKNYTQGYPEQPQPCVTAPAFGRYARKHVPFMSFKSIQENACGNIVAASRFEDDLNNQALPTYTFYTPDMDNDGHDTGVSYASKWLEGFLEPLLKNQALMKSMLIVVTFDESADHSPDAGNHIYTVFLGPMVKAREVQDHYNHYNVLRTIEENFGLCPLGEGDNGARPIADVWKRAET